VSSRKWATEKSAFWYKSSVASLFVVREDALAGRRRPAMRARCRYDSPLDVAVCGVV
jgi:hypothetical protein